MMHSTHVGVTDWQEKFPSERNNEQVSRAQTPIIVCVCVCVPTASLLQGAISHTVYLHL